MSQKSVFIPVAEFTAPAEGEFCSMRVNDEKQSPAHQLCNSPTLQTLIKCFQDLPEFPFPWQGTAGSEGNKKLQFSDRKQLLERKTLT